MKQLFFSVVVPTFNRYAMVSRAIESVLSQTFRDFELIVVDDHSTDYGEAAFSEFQDPRFTLVRNRRPKGACGARNTGLDLAKGKWVAFLDDDDTWLPEKLALEREFISSPDVNISTVMIYSDSINRSGSREWLSTKTPSEQFSDTKRNLLYQNYVGSLSTVTARVAACRAVGGFDETLPAMQDLEFFVRLCSKGAFCHLSRALTVRQVGHDLRITFDPSKKFAAAQSVHEKYRSEIDSSFRLRYIFGSRYYRFSVLAGDWKRALTSIPWFMVGAFIDRRQFRQDVSVTLRTATKRSRPRQITPF